MQDFTIDITEKKYTPIYIRMTTFINNQSNSFGSFDEKLTLKDNASVNLTFSMYKYVNGQLNPYIKFLVNDRLLQLKRGYYTYHLVITDIQPTITNENVKYVYTCQDEFSYSLSRRNVGINFSTDDSAEYEDRDYNGIWGSVSQCGPKSINELVNKLFEICNIVDWKMDEVINNLYFPFPDNLYSMSDVMKVSVDLTNTNPYNAIVEFAKLFNAIIEINYTVLPHIVSFKNKDKIKYQGFDLRPENNLQQFSYSEKGENLYNIMHVVGGENADGDYISILPTMPQALSRWLIENFDNSDLSNDELYIFIITHPDHSDIDLSFSDDDMVAIQHYFRALERIPQASSFIYDFSYWRDHYLMSLEEYAAIENDLCITLRNINFMINAYTPIYYREQSAFNKMIQKEEELISLMAAEEEHIAKLDNEKADTTLQFYNNKETITIGTEDDAQTLSAMKLGVIKPDQNITTSCTFEYGVYYNLNFTQYLPDWQSFIQKFNDSNLNFYLKYYSNNNYITIQLDKSRIQEPSSENTYIIIENIGIILPALYNATLYCTILDDFKNILVTDLSLDAISSVATTNYQSQLKNDIWTMDYIYYCLDLYGQNYVNNKKTTINTKITAKETEREKYITAVLKAVEPLSINYGNASTDLEKWYILRNNYGLTISATSNYSIYADYAYYKQLIDNIETYIGGPGTREQVAKDNSGQAQYYSFKGYYNHYLEQLNNLQQCIDDSECELNGDLYNKLYGYNGLISKQQEWWANFYANHSSIIRETTYTDTNQITSDGLYSAAIKQFENYKQPNQTYSTSYINSNMLLGYNNEAQIGDKIKIYQPELFNNNNSYIYVMQIINTTNNSLKLSQIQSAILQKDGGAVPINVLNIINDGMYCIIYFSCEEALDNIYKSIYCDINKISYKIISILQYEQEEPVTLQISGITKDLRSTVEQLTVTKYNNINYIVDKLLYNINN